MTSVYLQYTLNLFALLIDLDEEEEAAEADRAYPPVEATSPNQNSTDEEKLLISGTGSIEERQAGFTLSNR